MKKIIIVAITLLALTNCNSDIKPLTTTDEIYPIIDKIQTIDGTGIRNIRLYIIDSCEYIGHINNWHDVLTHKGNCKFCKERNNK